MTFAVKNLTRICCHLHHTIDAITFNWFLSTQANFSRAVSSLSKAQAKKVARFLPNPERHWGPKVRAGRQITSKHVSLLGPDALNGINTHGRGNGSTETAAEGTSHEGGEPDAKRQKTSDESTQS